jgi:hypothetical protein
MVSSTQFFVGIALGVVSYPDGEPYENPGHLSGLHIVSEWEF